MGEAVVSLGQKTRYFDRFVLPELPRFSVFAEYPCRYFKRYQTLLAVFLLP